MHTKDEADETTETAEVPADPDEVVESEPPEDVEVEASDDMLLEPRKLGKDEKWRKRKVNLMYL